MFICPKYGSQNYFMKYLFHLILIVAFICSLTANTEDTFRKPKQSIQMSL